MGITQYSLSEPTPITGILMVDDHDLVRLGLRTLVQSHTADFGKLARVYEARTLQEALDQYALHYQDIGLVLLDLHLPDSHGLSGLSIFIKRYPAARIVVLSGTNDPALMQQSLALGASNYLTKSGNLDNVVRYIRAIGLMGTSPADHATPTVPGDAANGRAVHRRAGEPIQITARQTEVLDAMLAGQSNRQIADLMHLSEGTVKNHVSTLLLLFGVRSRAQLISQLR